MHRCVCQVTLGARRWAKAAGTRDTAMSSPTEATLDPRPHAGSEARVMGMKTPASSD